LNICPVYQTTGGHSYGWVYPGPIGAIVTPLLTGLENASPLPFASSLCGACKQVCPVDIDLPRMLLDLRRDLVEGGHTDKIWNVGLKLWAYGTSSPGRFEMGSKAAAMATAVFQPHNLPGPLGGWTKYRGVPSFSKHSFHARWRERQKELDDADE
jgi:L-lactate dehydrogenase complex protein LldF